MSVWPGSLSSTADSILVSDYGLTLWPSLYVTSFYLFAISRWNNCRLGSRYCTRRYRRPYHGRWDVTSNCKFGSLFAALAPHLRGGSTKNPHPRCWVFNLDNFYTVSNPACRWQPVSRILINWSRSSRICDTFYLDTLLFPSRWTSRLGLGALSPTTKLLSWFSRARWLFLLH